MSHQPKWKRNSRNRPDGQMKSWEVRLVSYDHSGVLCCLLEVRGIDSPPNQSGWYQGLWGSWQEDLGNCKYWSSLETQRAEQTKIRLDLTWFLWLFTPNNLKFRSFFFFLVLFFSQYLEFTLSGDISCASSINLLPKTRFTRRLHFLTLFFPSTPVSPASLLTPFFRSCWQKPTH